MSKQKLLVSRCNEKTHRQNVYNDLESAKQAAEAMTIKLGHMITAFQCSVCTKYHIGRPAYGCDQKGSFDSESDANKYSIILRETDAVLTTPYRCKKCQKWHLNER